MARRDAGALATLPPSARRARAARERGFVPSSRDLVDAVTFAAFVAVAAAAGATGVARAAALLRAGLSASFSEPQARLRLAAHAWQTGVALTLVPLAVVMFAGVLASVLQTGGVVAWRGRSGGGAIARGAVVGAAARTSLKIAFFAAIAAFAVLPIARAVPRLGEVPPRTVLVLLGAGARALAVRMAVAFVAWGLLDWAWARARHQRALMMTRADAARETKESEGDPAVRAARRREHRALGEARLDDQVRGADFVLRGGPDLAVAIAYDRAGHRAPIVAAVGRGLLGARIVDLAQEAGVRVHLNDQLADALANVPAGAEIPDATFDAVAALLQAFWPA